MKVLVIDNDGFTRTVYESEFHQENIEVELAADGEDGIVKVKKINPTLVLLDLILPKKNGFEVISAIRADKKLSKIPIIVASGLNQETDIKEALRLGATKYFSKDSYSLKQIIQEVLKVLMGL